VKQISVDTKLLPRDSDVEPVISRYAEIMQEQDMPPIVVFHDGKKWWLADGLYRLKATKQNGTDKVLCEVLKGTKKDAVWYASGANREHGQPLKPSERRRALTNVLKAGFGVDKTDSQLSTQIGLSRKVVSSVRNTLEADGEAPKAPEGSTKAKMQAAGKKGAKAKADKAAATTGGGSSPPPNPPKKPSKKKKEDEGYTGVGSGKDEIGQVIPSWLEQVDEDTSRIRVVQNHLTQVIDELLEIGKIPAGKNLPVKQIVNNLSDVRTVQLREGMFYCGCPECIARGKVLKSCKKCSGVGWLTRSQYHDAK
jgi:ParB-like chromosome segregation protein Spo0J